MTAVPSVPEDWAAGSNGVVEVDDVPPPRKTDLRDGDLIVLGTHGVVCGSADSIADVSRVLNGALADVAVASPPYTNLDIRYSRHIDRQRREEHLAFIEGGDSATSTPLVGVETTAAVVDAGWRGEIELDAADAKTNKAYVYALAGARAFRLEIVDHFLNWAQANGQPTRDEYGFQCPSKLKSRHLGCPCVELRFQQPQTTS